jgi:cyclohexyl-isocyanide hydratase
LAARAEAILIVNSISYGRFFQEFLIMIDLKKKKNGILIFPDVEELDFVGVFEILAKIQSLKDKEILTIETSLQVEILAYYDIITCANGLMVKPHVKVDSFKGYDMLIIPGGKGVNKLIEDKKFLELVKNFAKELVVCSVCTGSFILGVAGLLKGKVATTHYKEREALKEYCNVTDSRVHIGGNIVSAGGVSCSLDLGLKILEIVYDKIISNPVADHLEIPLEMKNLE